MLEKRYNHANYSPRKGKFKVRKINVERLHPRFEVLARDYLDKSGRNQEDLAKLIGIQRTHLNSLLSGVRPLTAYYLVRGI